MDGLRTRPLKLLLRSVSVSHADPDLLWRPDQKPCIALVDCAIKCTKPKMHPATHAARKTATKGSATMLIKGFAGTNLPVHGDR
jgi:hypothetical protein